MSESQLLERFITLVQLLTGRSKLATQVESVRMSQCHWLVLD